MERFCQKNYAKCSIMYVKCARQLKVNSTTRKQMYSATTKPRTGRLIQIIEHTASSETMKSIAQLTKNGCKENLRLIARDHS